MEKTLIIRVMPTVYLPHNLIHRPNQFPEYKLEKREVYLPDMSSLEVILMHLSELMLIQPRNFLFCLKWGHDCYYFEDDGTYIHTNEAPSSEISL